jgi:EAL and modified HD-GYP domain-containing signal transduction protein
MPTLDSAREVYRQPIVDKKNRIFGYEIYDRSVKIHSAQSDRHLIAYLLSHVQSMGDRCFFLNTTLDMLGSDSLTLLRPENTVVELPLITDPGQVTSTVAEWAKHIHRLRGLRVRFSMSGQAVSKAYEPWLEVASFIKVDMLKNGIDEAKQLIGYAARNTGATVIAEKVETISQFHELCAAGVTFFQGRRICQETKLVAKVQYPSQKSIDKLLGVLMADADIDALEDVIKHDPLLSINIVRIVNSAAMGLKEPVTSFKHAVMLMGRKKLSRWATLMSMCANAQNSDPSLVIAATQRGKLMEILCESQGIRDTEGAFMCGSFSLMNKLLGDIDLSSALGGVHLVDNVSDALIHSRGPLWHLLQIAQIIESGTEEERKAMFQSHGLDALAVDAMKMQAAAWADRMH